MKIFARNLGGQFESEFGGQFNRCMHDIYKIRIAIASKNKGKSGGARVLSFVKVTKTSVLLFSIYSKGEVDNLTDMQIRDLIKDYL